MTHVQNTKIAFIIITGLLGLSFLIAHLSLYQETAVVGHLWQYYDKRVQASYVLLGKVSNNKGGIFGATRHSNNSEFKKITPLASRLVGKDRYLVYVVNVDSLQKKPAIGNYQWVTLDEVIKATRYAHRNKQYRNVWAQAKDNNKVIVDDQLLIAFVKTYRNRIYGESGTRTGVLL